MSTVIVDRAMRDKLFAATGEVEIRDEAGELIGVLKKTPKFDPYANVDWPSDEEIERRLREGRSYTAEEVMDHLRKLEDGLNGREVA
jgi:hypothetical protein